MVIGKTENDNSFNTLRYWQQRVTEQGFDAVSTIGDIDAITIDEMSFLTAEIVKIYPEPVDLAIDFGAGWGRLLPVMMKTSKNQVLVDFVDDNERLWKRFYLPNNSCLFVVSSINNFHWKKLADYVLTSFSLLHILDDTEYRASVKNIVDSVRVGGHLFIYESYNESGEVASHCSSRNREQFLEPFSICEIIKELNWRSNYQPYETDCHQPIKLFIFRR